jgi:hypothetical protein
MESELEARFIAQQAANAAALRMEQSFEHAERLSWSSSVYEYCMGSFFNVFLRLYCEVLFFRKTVGWCYRFPMLRTFLMRYISLRVYEHPMLCSVFRRMGVDVQSRIGGCRAIYVIGGVLSTMLASCALISFAVKASFATAQSRPDTAKKPVPKDDRISNVWYNESFVATSFDVTRQIESWKNMPQTQVLAYVQHNTVSIELHYHRGGVAKVTETHAFCLGGNLYVMNFHALPKNIDDENFRCEMFDDRKGSGIQFKGECFLSCNAMLVYPERDLAFFQFMGVPPRRRLWDIIPPRSYRGRFGGFYVRSADMPRIVANIQRVQSTTEIGTYDTWTGIVQEPTVVGDCGMPMVMFTEQGPMIVGIHAFGGGVFRGHQVCAVPLDREILSEVEKHNWDFPMVQPGTPNLKAECITYNLVPVHAKSPIRYVEDGGAIVYGSLDGFRPVPKSRVCRTLLYDALERRGVADVKNAAPVLPHGKAWMPWYRALKDQTNPRMSLNVELMLACAENYKQKILRGLSSDDLATLHPVDWCTAINGVCGMGYMDKLNRNTSTGFPYKTCKKFFLEEPAVKTQVNEVICNREMMARILKMDESYRLGICAAPIFCANLKDEARSKTKVLDGNIRVFMGGPMDWSIVHRKYFMTFQRMMKLRRNLFEQQVGVRAQSTDWQEMYLYVTQDESYNVFDGDYAHFDKDMAALSILLHFKVEIDICRVTGNFSEEDLNAMWCVAFDVAYPTVDFHGDLIQFVKGNPSGQCQTVETNGTSNVIDIRYAYAKSHPDAASCRTRADWLRILDGFEQRVVACVYGDDNLVGVRKDTPWFNHSTMAKALGEVGITYTMADKGAESRPYIPYGEISFLKRKFVRDDDVGAILGPLEEASIWKMVSLCVKSRSVSMEVQAIAEVASAVREWFFHGKTKFNENRTLLMDVVHEAGLDMYVDENTFPTWGVLKTAFWVNSESTVPREELS